MLYLRAVDDAALTHATDSTAMPAPLCNNPTGRTRLDYRDTREYDPLSGTATTRRLPIEVHRASDVQCPSCAAILAPGKIRSLAAPAEPPGAVVRTAVDRPQPRRRLRRTT